MSLERSLLRFRKRNKRFPPIHNKIHIEPLEQRLLLSSDLTYSAPSGTALDLTIRMQKVEEVNTLQLINNFNQSIVHSQTLSETDQVIIIGGELDDNLTIDFRNPFSIPIFFDGGEEATSIGDSLQVIGDGVATGSYTPDSVEAGSGKLSIGGTIINFSGLEPITISDISQYTFTTSGSQDVLTIDSPSSGRNRISGTSDGISFESITFYNVANFIIDTATNDEENANDSITINSRLVTNNLQNLTILTGAGNDTLTIHTTNFSLPVSGGAFIFNGGDGNDTIDFDASSGGYTQTLTITQSGPDTILTGADGSKITLAGGTVENIDDVNINIQKDSLMTMLNDFEALSDWMRNLASYDKLGSQLPLIFAGDRVNVTLGNIVEFADAIDFIRAKLHDYYTTLGSTFNLNNLETFLKTLPNTIKHYAGSIVGDFLKSFGSGETANIKISLDGGTEYPISFKGGSLKQILGNINNSINNITELAGKIVAYDADGRIAFKVTDPDVIEFTISCLSTDPAFTKLGLRLSQTMKAAGLELGSLTSDDDFIQNLNTWIKIDPLTLTPILSLKLPFILNRNNKFGVDFGKDIRDLKGIAFDASAELEVDTQITADLELGLELDSSPEFWVKLNDLSARAKITPPSGENNLNADLTIGFLGAHVNGSVNLDAGLSINVPNILNLNDLKNFNFSSVTITPTSNSFSADLGVSVIPGLNDGENPFNPAGLRLTLSSANPFDPSSFKFDAFKQIGDFSELFNFSNLSPFDMITLLKKIGSSLDDVTNSTLFSSFNIPFVSGAISDVLDVVKTVEKGLLFDSGDDGIDDGTALVTDLNNALAKAGLSEKFLVQGNGEQITLLAIDDSINAFSVSGPSQIGLNGNATPSGHTLKLSGTPINFGKLSSDATIIISVTTSEGTQSFNVPLSKSLTDDNKKVGNDIPKLLNAGGAPTFRTAQEFVSRLVTLLNLDRTLIKPNFDHLSDELTFRLQFDADLPSLELPVNFNLDLEPFVGFQSTGQISLIPDVGIDLTFGVSLGAGGTITDNTPLSELIQPLEISENPAFTGADLGAYAIYGRLSADAPFYLTIDGNEYLITVTKSSTDDNNTAGDLATDINTALQNTHKIVGGVPETTPTNLSGKVTAGVISGTNRLKLTVLATVSTFSFSPKSSDLIARELGFQNSVILSSTDPKPFLIEAVKDVPVIIGRLPSDATFNITMAGGGPGSDITIEASKTEENRTVLDLLNDIQSAISLSSLNNYIEVLNQGNALVFKSKNTNGFNITSKSGADKLGLGLSGTTHSSNKYDLIFKLSDGSNYNVALKKDDGSPCLTIGDVKNAIQRDTSNKVTIDFNPQGTALRFTDTTFKPFIGTQPNPNPAIFRIEAINGSLAGSKLGIIASDSAGAGEKPDGVIIGTPIAGTPLIDRLFIKEPGFSDPPMLHADLSFGTGAGISATANFGFVGVNLEGGGTLKPKSRLL